MHACSLLDLPVVPRVAIFGTDSGPVERMVGASNQRQRVLATADEGLVWEWTAILSAGDLNDWPQPYLGKALIWNQ